MSFKQYKRKQIAELRDVTQEDIEDYQTWGHIFSTKNQSTTISISDADRQNGSPKLGDMIARNPKNHEDSWLVAQEYFNDNFEEA